MQISVRMKRVLRLLITLLGGGVGVAVAMGTMQMLQTANPLRPIGVGSVMATYSIAIVLGVLIGFVLSKRAVEDFARLSVRVEDRLMQMSLGQLVSYILGLICGLLVATLLAQILHFLGDSMFTATMAVLMYLVLGAAGVTIGHLREKDITRLIDRMGCMHSRKFIQRRGHLSLKPHGCAKLLDTSVLIDGRLIDVCKTGFLEGELMVPQCVLNELQSIADAADPVKRARGQRGLDVMQKLQTMTTVRMDHTQTTGDTGAQLLQLAREWNAPIVTGDQTLMRAAQLSGIRTLNLNALANALRPVVHAGDELTVLIAKEGKEPTQGVGYLDDGTMVVADGGRQHLGQSVSVVVTSALQTNAGRMIFAKVKEA